jgi:hypothetical protein
MGRSSGRRRGTPRWGSEWKKAVAKYFNRSFSIGASAFPQNGGYNPTGTVGALTSPALQAIGTKYLKKPGMPV